MSVAARAGFFDGIAAHWDGWHDLGAVGASLAAGLAQLGVAQGDTAVDVGCGTGNLTLALLGAVGQRGRVVALDPSAGMLERARAKVDDPRAAFHRADAERLPLLAGAADHVFFLGVWPHLDRPAAAAAEAFRVLRPGGAVHVWHLIGRAAVNAVHAAGGEPIRADVLAPAEETAAVLRDAGFEVACAVDDGARYLVSARRPE